MDQNILQKQIQIVNLQPQYIAKLNKNKYFISGNDGIKYETWDADYFAQRKIGEWLNVQYTVRTVPGNNGRMWTNYDIYTPKAAPTNNNQRSNPNQAIDTIIKRIDALENNIIAAIRIHCGDMKINPDLVPNINDANADLQIESDRNRGIPVIQENGDGTYSQDMSGNGNPF